MSDGVNFSGKLSKKIDLSAITVEGMNEAKKKEIDKIFNTVTGGDSANTLTTDELVVLSDVDTNHDGKITDDEAKAAYDKLDNNVKQQLTNKQVTQNDYVAYLKAMAKKNEELVAQEENVGNKYTIQLGEILNDLVERVLESRGKTNPTDEEKEACLQAIINANKDSGAIKFDNNGNVKWLVAGEKLIIPTDTQSDDKKRVKDQNNYDQVAEKYRAWRDGRGPLKGFIYAIDADGKTYEVRGGVRTEFDPHKGYDPNTGKQTGGAGGSQSSGGSQGAGGSQGSGNTPVKKIEMSDEFQLDKIKEDDCKSSNDPNKKYDINDVKAKAQKAIDILNKFNTPDDIKECTEKEIKQDGSVVFDVKFKDNTIVQLVMLPDGNVQSVITFDSDGKKVAEVFSDSSMHIAMDDDFVNVNGIVKDFNKIATHIQSSDKVKNELERSNKEIPYDINHYEVEGSELGLALYDQLKGSSKNSNTRKLLDQINEKNVYNVVKKFNEKSPKSNIIKYLVNESGIKNEDIAKIVDSVMKCAHDYKLHTTNEYKDLKAFKELIDKDKTKDPKDTDWAERLDKAVSALLDKIKQVSDKKGKPDKESDVVADYKIRDNKVYGEDIGHRLYKEVKGSSSTKETKKILGEITKQNAYYVINKFNEQSPKEHIMKYLVSEGGLTNESISLVLSNILDCASDYGLTNTKEYRDVLAYKTYCADEKNKASNPDDEKWAERMDNAVEALMAKIKTVAAKNNEEL